MRRHRTIAAAPVRSASESWGIVSELITISLDRSSTISRAEVEEELEIVSGVGKMLIAGGHLDDSPVLVNAGKLDLMVRTVSGNTALTLEENLSAVPGAAEADDWALQLPAVSPLEDAVARAVSPTRHVTSGDPKAMIKKADEESRDEAVDLEALRAWAKESG